jgi:hypothetical protein
MDPYKILKLGDKYSKKDLSDLLDQDTLSIVREGLYHCKNSNSTLLFVDLEKKGKEDRFHFDDFFEEDYFHWDSQTTQHINSPKIQEIVRGERVPHLFVRIQSKIKNQTQPFLYCGRLQYLEYEEKTSKPVHIIFHSLDYDDFTQNQELLEIYQWVPSKIGKSTKSKIVKRGVISNRRRQIYTKPNETERKGLVVSRVGQGYYRQQIMEKWGNKCPVTECDLTMILISSHIVPWSECNDEERLDVENGILLSPNIDSLFDKHLISFQDNGEMIISKSLSTEVLNSLGINTKITIPISEGMKPYLEKHRNRLYKR